MKLSRFAIIFLGGLFLTACSSNKLIKAYEGDALPKDKVATLTAGENIALLSVNGKTVPDYLLTNISVNYGLVPGDNTLVFQYESVWAKAKLGQDSPRSEAVASEPRQLLVNVSAGDRLSFRYPQAGNIREAKALASTFEAEVVNQKGAVLGRSSDVVIEQIQVADTYSSAGGSYVSVASLDDGLPAIEAMKLLWEKLSAEEKKVFLKWAFQ